MIKYIERGYRNLYRRPPWDFPELPGGARAQRSEDLERELEKIDEREEGADNNRP